MITLRTARINRPLIGTIELRAPNGAGAFALPQANGTYRLRLYHHRSTAVLAEGSIGNGKITSITVTAEATVISYNFPATDLPSATTPLGYGSMELLSTADSDTVIASPLKFETENKPYTAEDGEKLVVFNEKLVCVVTATVLQYILGPTAIAVNMLAPAAAATGSYDGSTLTLNLPQGATGSNGIMSATEAARGTRALMLAPPQQSLRKGVLVDMVGGGVAVMDDAAGHVLASLENLAAITLTSSAGSMVLNRKKKLVASTANRLRFLHLNDGSSAGALIEAAATNLIRQSQNFPVTWTATGVTLSTVIGPDGIAASASVLTDDNSTGNHRLSQSVAGLVSGTTYVASLYVRAGTWSRLQLLRASGGSAIFNLATGVVISTSGASLVGSGITPVGDGWYRIWIADNAALTSFNFILGLVDAANVASYTGASANSVRIYGAQLEEAATPSSYMPTAAAAVTRAADVINLPVSGMALDNVSLAGEFIVPAPGSINFVGQLRGDVSNRLLLQCNAVNNIVAQCILNGVTTSITLATAVAQGTRVRFAIALDTEKKIIRGKATGIAAPAEVAVADTATATPVGLSAGSNNGTASHLNSGLISLLTFDRSWTAAEIASFTG